MFVLEIQSIDISKMDKFITQTIYPLLPSTLSPEENQQKISNIEINLKAFISSQLHMEMTAINKEMGKKTKQLFMLSSDNQTYRQKVEDLESKLTAAKNQIAVVEQEKLKAKVAYEKQIAQLTKNLQNMQIFNKKQVARLKMEKEVTEQSYKAKLKEVVNSHQLQLNKAIDEEKKLQQQQSESMKKQFEAEKTLIMKQNSEKKREMIKKYEDKIAKLTTESEDKLFVLNKQLEQLKKQTKEMKVNFQNKIAALENNISRLKGQITREEQSHSKYKDLYEKLYKEFSQYQQKFIKEKQAIEKDLHETKISLMQQERKYMVDMKEQKEQFMKIIEEKDQKYNITVENITAQFTTKISTIQNKFIEEREIAISEVEVLRDKENYGHQQKYRTLKEEYDELKNKYEIVSKQCEEKLRKNQKEHADFIQSLNSRKDYQMKVSGKNAEREFNALRNKYQLQIKAIYSSHSTQLDELTKKHRDEKIALANKITSQYQSMLNDQRASNQIQIKQKLIQFERKAKGYETKLKDAEKKKTQLKVAAERVKMEMQMRVDSMIELNEAYENQIANTNEKIQNIERQKERIINQYELKLLLLRNQNKATKDEYEQREFELKELLQSKVRAKNQQMSKVLSRVKKQTDTLVEAHQKRVQALEKQYNELKKVMGQKTSLPQDIEALKVFHDAYLDKQKELALEKQKVQYLQRQLWAKDAIDKVFAQKGHKQTYKNYSSTQPLTLINFKSQQL